MKAAVAVNMGDVFEGGTDLTVLPCGAKPTWTASVDRWIDQFAIPNPRQLVERMRLGDVTPIAPFSGPQRITSFVAYAASVSNDRTNSEAIRKIGRQIGEITVTNSNIRIVESVLFGTGHGRLDDSTAARALAAGFRESAAPLASLCIHVQAYDRYLAVQNALAGGFWRRLVNAIQLTPSFMGMGINLKKLFVVEGNK